MKRGQIVYFDHHAWLQKKFYNWTAKLTRKFGLCGALHISCLIEYSKMSKTFINKTSWENLLRAPLHLHEFLKNHLVQGQQNGINLNNQAGLQGKDY